jgi:hypothetical protein
MKPCDFLPLDDPVAGQTAVPGKLRLSMNYWKRSIRHQLISSADASKSERLLRLASESEVDLVPSCFSPDNDSQRGASSRSNRKTPESPWSIQ